MIRFAASNLVECFCPSLHNQGSIREKICRYAMLYCLAFVVTFSFGEMLLTKHYRSDCLLKDYDKMKFYSNRTFTLIFVDPQNETDYRLKDQYTAWCVDSNE